MPARLLTAALVLAFAAQAGAELPLRITSPQPLLAGTHVPIAFEGENLQLVSSVTLQRPGGGPAELAVVQQSGNQLLATGNLASQPVGLYTTTLNFQSGGQQSLANALELSRSPSMLLAGASAADAFEPLAGFDKQASTEYLIDIPPSHKQPFIGISFFLAPGSPAPAGRFTIRYRVSEESSFSTTSLDGLAPDWILLFQDAAPRPSATGELFFPCLATILAEEGDTHIQFSVCHETTAASSARLLQWTSAPQTGRRGRALELPSSPDTWDDEVPPAAQRTYLSRVPVMRFSYTGRPVAANFEASARRVLPGTEVTFTDRSSSNVTEWAWDLNGDGVMDATGPVATRTYDRPGLYTVVLTARDGYAEDAETKLDLIEVIDPATLGQDTWAVR